jgi:hypothetical protein
MPDPTLPLSMAVDSQRGPISYAVDYDPDQPWLKVTVKDRDQRTGATSYVDLTDYPDTDRLPSVLVHLDAPEYSAELGCRVMLAPRANAN